MLSFSKQTMVRCEFWRNIPQELTARLQSTLGQMQPELAYPMAIRLPRSRRGAISVRRIVSANTAHPP